MRSCRMGNIEEGYDLRNACRYFIEIKMAARERVDRFSLCSAHVLPTDAIASGLLGAIERLVRQAQRVRSIEPGFALGHADADGDR